MVRVAESAIPGVVGLAHLPRAHALHQERNAPKSSHRPQPGRVRERLPTIKDRNRPQTSIESLDPFAGGFDQLGSRRVIACDHLGLCRRIALRQSIGFARSQPLSSPPSTASSFRRAMGRRSKIRVHDSKNEILGGERAQTRRGGDVRHNELGSKMRDVPAVDLFEQILDAVLEALDFILVESNLENLALEPNSVVGVEFGAGRPALDTAFGRAFELPDHAEKRIGKASGIFSTTGTRCSDNQAPSGLLPASGGRRRRPRAPRRVCGNRHRRVMLIRRSR